ncbi:hypothetical protein HQQ94_15260 [Shewanella sp. VB17]|uniref:hypothetical protein n=1 Tax=Shewanella sp. VB17 TaxID=2739432 RepID=UPI001566E922|nr:hypothetical protein [Shewanella sp. VB17]NRD74570.1 hypothetical protein [Shewanella sp. VB17]
MKKNRMVCLCEGFFWYFLIAGMFDASAEKIRLVNVSGDIMANMVVYLQPKHSIEPIAMDNIRPPSEVHQHNKQFTPYITVIQKGYELQFVNDDDITHHIYSAAGPKRFSFKLRKGSAMKNMVFDQVGHVSMGCNVHDWMSGHLLVLDTPYFGITNDMGEIEFNDLPHTDYILTIWHPQLLAADNRQSQALTLPFSERLTLTIMASMADIPAQQSLNDFDFLEGY